jgi:pimeloyl-ACP methyl ester carboxylesterase
LRAAVVEFTSGLNLHGVTLAGESLGAALALSASIDLKDRVSQVVAKWALGLTDGDTTPKPLPSTR